MKQILITTDLSKEAARAIPIARAQAEELGKSSVHFSLLHVIESPAQMYVSEFGLGTIDVAAIFTEIAESAQQELDRLAGELPGIAVTTFVVKAEKSVPAEIVDFSVQHNIELIVMSTHGYSGFQHFLLGSVAERVIRSAPCPVLVIPAKGPEKARS